jgi:hypothetical protein
MMGDKTLLERVIDLECAVAELKSVGKPAAFIDMAFVKSVIPKQKVPKVRVNGRWVDEVA